MIPQRYPLFATFDAEDLVWAVVGWQPPDLPGHPLVAVLAALGAAGEGRQETAEPDAFWPTVDTAEAHLRSSA